MESEVLKDKSKIQVKMCFLDGETKHGKPLYKTLTSNKQKYKKAAVQCRKCSTCTNKDLCINPTDATLKGFFLHEAQ